MKTDKRIKLTDEQKLEILAIPLKPGNFPGHTEIARTYGVNRRTIDYLFNPDKLLRNRELAKERKKANKNL